MKLSELSRFLDGALEGNDVEISGVSGLENQSAGTIAFADNKKNLELLSASAVAALIIPENLVSQNKPAIKLKDPKLAFSKVLELFSPYKPYRNEIYPQVHVEKSAHIGSQVTILPFTAIMDNAHIGDNTVIYSQVLIGKNVRIGKDCIIKAGVKIDDETVIGDRVIIHHNSVVGGDGFGYIQKDGINIKVPQIGLIRIEDDVEIGACVTIDRATLGETVISKGVKVDNLVQIAHNVKVGDNTILVSQVGIAGSTTIGKNCFMTGQVGVSDHVTIGDNVVVLAQSGVESKQVIESGRVVFGSPARDMMEMKRIYSAQTRLPEMLKTLNLIKKKIGLDEKTNADQ